MMISSDLFRNLCCVKKNYYLDEFSELIICYNNEHKRV